MKKFLKKQFELWAKMYWLKKIEKENRKVRKAYEQFKAHQRIAEGLFTEYMKMYSNEEKPVEAESEIVNDNT